MLLLCVYAAAVSNTTQIDSEGLDLSIDKWNEMIADEIAFEDLGSSAAELRSVATSWLCLSLRCKSEIMVCVFVV